MCRHSSVIIMKIFLWIGYLTNIFFLSPCIIQILFISRLQHRAGVNVSIIYTFQLYLDSKNKEISKLVDFLANPSFTSANKSENLKQ